MGTGWDQSGEATDGRTVIELALEVRTRSGARMLEPMICCGIAIALGQSGQTVNALDGIDHAIGLVEELDEHIHEAELHRIKGEMLSGLGTASIEQAELSFQDALQVAKQQNAKSWVLRAATSLAGLWQSQGKREEGRDGDRANAVLAAAGYNFSRLIRWF